MSAWGKSAWADEVDDAAASGTLHAAKEEEFPSLGSAAQAAAKGKKQKAQKISLGDFLKAPEPPAGSYQVRASGEVGALTAPWPLFRSRSTNRPCFRPHSMFFFNARPTRGKRGRFPRQGARIGVHKTPIVGNRGFAPLPPQAPGKKVQDDDDFLLNLPKAPRARDPNAPPEEPRGRGDRPLGGAFRDDGRYDRGGRGGGRGDRGDRGDRPPREDMGPSRADMADDWGSGRKFQPGPEGGESRGFGGFRDRGDRDRRGGDFGPSRADTGDTWGKAERPTGEGPSGERS